MIEAYLLLNIGKSLLLAGAPGIGKTRDARRLSREFTGVEPVMVTGRSDLSYEDLVYSYELVNGSSKVVLGKLAISILSSWVRLLKGYPPRWIVFDELNRFNAELVLGELFTGLDLEHRLSCPIITADLLDKILNDNKILKVIADNAKDQDFLHNVDVKDVEETIKRLLNEFHGAPSPLSWRAIATINLLDRAHLFN